MTASQGSTAVADFAERLRRTRTAAHLTQAELAEKLGVAVRTLRSWEAGVIPRPAQRRKLERFFGRSRVT